MLQLVYRNYHLGNQSNNKKAVIISFTEQVIESNSTEYSRQLKELVSKNYDSYIFLIKKPEEVSSYALLLMIAFSNTYTRKTGLLIKDTKSELFNALAIDTIFIIGNNIKTILIQLEKAGVK